MTLPPDDAVFNFTMDFSDIETVLMGDAHDSTNVTVVDIFMEQLAMTLNVYYTPVLIILGFIGNMVSVIVFFRSKLRLQSTSQYLSALALADTLFLWQLLPPWLKAVGASTLFSRHGFCQLFVYLSYVSCNVSSWLVVAFTIERFVAVVYPLKRNAMCTVRRARYIIGTLTTIALLINLPVLRFAVPSGNDCNIDELLMAHAARFNLFDTLVSFTLPLAMIVVLNAWIMWGVYRVSRARPNLTRQQWPVHARSPRTARASACRRSQQRITKMLLIVSSVFVLLNLPAYTMRIVAYANNMGENEYSGKWAALQQVCLLFFNTNFGINFVLYCLTGQNFRRALKETFPCLRRREPVFGRRDFTDQPARASSVSTLYAHSLSNCTEATSTIAMPANVLSSACTRGGIEQAGIGQGGEGRLGTRRNETERMEIAGPSRRQRDERKVIQRWRFDNSKQKRRELIEMKHMPDGNM